MLLTRLLQVMPCLKSKREFSANKRIKLDVISLTIWMPILSASTCLRWKRFCETGEQMPTIWENFQQYLSQLSQPHYIPVCFHFSECVHKKKKEEKKKGVIALRNKLSSERFPS